MRSNRAGLGNMVMWLASADRKRAAWSQTLYEFTAGTKRSGKKAGNTGLAAQIGKAFARTTGETWGGLDAVASDAMVAEEHVADREFVPKDDSDTDTPGLEPWRLEGAEKNIRLAKPLEALVARANKVGPGFEKEHVAYPVRGQLISHHRPDDPPINSSPVFDPGDGSRDDWQAGLHGVMRVRPWLDKFCAAAPNPRDTASSFEDDQPTLALLLNATKSGGDNSGWLGAHFAKAEATLSAEAFGFAHPADDGNHRLGFGFDGTEILEGGLEAYRTKFGSRGSLLYSPLAMSPEQWPFPGRSIFPVLTEIREDYTDTHAKQCGRAPGYKKLVTWVSLLDPPPPHRPPLPPEGPPPPPLDDPPRDPKYPGLIKVPLEGDGVPPASHSGGDDGPAPQDIYPAAGIVPPANYGERAAAAMNQLEATSMQYRARPGMPDGRLTLRMIGESEVDNLAGLMYGYTIKQAFEAPVVADDVAAPEYLSGAPADNDDPNQRWATRLSNLAELSFDPAGGITGRTPARGPGSVALMPSNAPVDWLFSENKDRWAGPVNDLTRIIMAGKNAAGVEIAGRTGLGLRTLRSGRIASGLEVSLSYEDGIDLPRVQFWTKDQSGSNNAAGKFYFNGTLFSPGGGSGDITSASNLTTGRIPVATGVKQIDTPLDVEFAEATVDSPDDTLVFLPGPGYDYTRINGNVAILLDSPFAVANALELEPAGANPGGTAANTLWADSGAANRFKVGTNTLAYTSELPSISGLLAAANNLSDVADLQTSLYNLLGGMTAPLSSPFATTSKLPIVIGSAANYATIQTLFDSISSLTAATPGLSDLLAATNGSNVAKAVTPQKLLDLVNSLAAKTAPVAADKMLVVDSAASNVAKSATLANLFKVIDGLNARTPILTSKLAGYLASASDAGTFTPQNLWDLLDSLSNGTVTLSSKMPAYISGAKTTTPQSLLDLIHSTTAKTTLADADELAMIDSAASNVAKRVTWANVRAQQNGDIGGCLSAEKSSDSALTSTTLADLSGLSVNLLAGATYRIKGIVFVSLSAASAGLKCTLGGTATVTRLKAAVNCMFNNASPTTGRATALGSGGIALTPASLTTMEVWIDGTIVVNAAGTLTIMGARNAASGTATFQASSGLEVTRIA